MDDNEMGVDETTSRPVQMLKVTKPQHPMLVEAIETRQRLACMYHRKARIIEPQCYGLGRKGQELLRVHQIEGGDQKEPLFSPSDIEDLQVIGTFTRPGPRYKRGDSAMVTIFAQL